MKQKTQNPTLEFAQSFVSHLQCPKTKQALHWTGHAFENLDGTQFPVINSLPWLLPYPQSALDHWQSKSKELQSYFENRILKLKESLALNTLPSTEQRLKILVKALQHNHETLKKILQPLSLQKSLASDSSNDKIPGHQSLTLYLKNIFRDWAWQSTENKISLEILQKIIPATWSPKKFLALGAGACRLPLDLHQAFQLPCSVAVDINPLLFFVAQEMLTNQSFSLYEIPTAPISLAEVAIQHQLKNPSPGNAENFHMLFADVHHLPFKDKTFDSVLTPWLIDILPIDFSRLAQKINRVLPLSGEWFNFGPLGFMFADESQCLTFEEIQEALSAQGFELKEHHIQQIPYLESANSSQKRQEKILCFRAVKVRDVRESDFHFLPDWLLNYDLPIPLDAKIQSHQGQAKLNADILFSINGQRSINDLISLMSLNYKISSEKARSTLISFLHKYFESQLRQHR